MPGVELEPGEQPLVAGRVEPAGDQTRAEDALRAMRAGIELVYRGDARGLHQLYSAIKRRIERRHRIAAGRRNRQSADALELFHRERISRHEEHRLLSRLVIELGPDYTPLYLSHRPDVAAACSAAWAPSERSAPLVISYRELLGLLGAWQWQCRGVFVPALGGRVHARYGVFPPTRHDYLELVASAPPARGLKVFDLGTGTGVLALVQARSGARDVVATDSNPVAVECARDNVARFGLDAIVRVEHRDLYPEGTADRVLFNPPWLPGKPRTPLERGIFDPEGALLARFFEGLGSHLSANGEGWLVLGDLAERLGLRPADHVERLAAEHGFYIGWVSTRPAPRQGRPDEPERLKALRAEEQVRLICVMRNA